MIKDGKTPTSRTNNSRDSQAQTSQTRDDKSQRNTGKQPSRKKVTRPAKRKRDGKRFRVPTLKELYTANVHAGDIKRKWNPQMKPFLFDMPQLPHRARRKNIHYFDLVKSRYFLKRAVCSVYRYRRQGHPVLFVGTQPRTSKLVKKAALSCEAAYIHKKWLGGILTNWETVSASIGTLLELNHMEKTGQMRSYGKKEQSRMAKKKSRLLQTIGGLQSLSIQPPGLVIIVGQNDEYKAVDECQRMKIHNLTILDSDCDPRKAEMYIPANDNAKAAIILILKHLAFSIRRGNYQYELLLEAERKMEAEKAAAERRKQRGPGRGRGRGRGGRGTNGRGRKDQSLQKSRGRNNRSGDDLG